MTTDEKPNIQDRVHAAILASALTLVDGIGAAIIECVGHGQGVPEEVKRRLEESMEQAKRSFEQVLGLHKYTLSEANDEEAQP